MYLRYIPGGFVLLRYVNTIILLSNGIIAYAGFECKMHFLEEIGTRKSFLSPLIPFIDLKPLNFYYGMGKSSLQKNFLWIHERFLPKQVILLL